MSTDGEKYKGRTNNRYNALPSSITAGTLDGILWEDRFSVFCARFLAQRCPRDGAAVLTGDPTALFRVKQSEAKQQKPTRYALWIRCLRLHRRRVADQVISAFLDGVILSAPV